MKIMQKTPPTIAHPEPFYNVVLLFKMNITAVKTNEAKAKIVTNQMTIFGSNNPTNVITKLNPKDIARPYNRSSIAFCEFHLS